MKFIAIFCGLQLAMMVIIVMCNFPLDPTWTEQRKENMAGLFIFNLIVGIATIICGFISWAMEKD